MDTGALLYNSLCTRSFVCVMQYFYFSHRPNVFFNAEQELNIHNNVAYFDDITRYYAV